MVFGKPYRPRADLPTRSYSLRLLVIDKHDDNDVGPGQRAVCLLDCCPLTAIQNLIALERDNRIASDGCTVHASPLPSSPLAPWAAPPQPTTTTAGTRQPIKLPG